MRNVAHRHVLAGLICIPLVCTSQEGRTMQNTGEKRNVIESSPKGISTEEPKQKLAWDSPKVLDAKRKWESICRELDKASPAEQKGIGATMLTNVLRENLSDVDLRALAASCATLPIKPEDRDVFTNQVLDLMVVIFVKTGDRDNLITLLSTRCPDRIGYHAPLEYYLVVQGKEMKDPIVILDEAYGKCQAPEVRKQLASALRHAFVALGVTGNTDDQFVKNAMQWYDEHKDHVVVNLEYAHNILLVNLRPLKNYENNPLFILKDRASGSVSTP